MGCQLCTVQVEKNQNQQVMLLMLNFHLLFLSIIFFIENNKKEKPQSQKRLNRCSQVLDEADRSDIFDDRSLFFIS